MQESRDRAPDHVTSVIMPLLRHEPRHGPQQRGPKFRRIPGGGPANPTVVMTTRACPCHGGHFTPSLAPLSNPLIAINGPDTWTYYRIQIVIYDVRLTAHELTSGGSLWVTLSCGWPNATTFIVMYSVLSLPQSAVPSAVPA
jgi:hypothetical protein